MKAKGPVEGGGVIVVGNTVDGAGVTVVGSTVGAEVGEVAGAGAASHVTQNTLCSVSAPIDPNALTVNRTWLPWS